MLGTARAKIEIQSAYGMSLDYTHRNKRKDYLMRKEDTWLPEIKWNFKEEGTPAYEVLTAPTMYSISFWNFTLCKVHRRFGRNCSLHLCVFCTRIPP
jgi:hypothetical protein